VTWTTKIGAWALAAGLIFVAGIGLGWKIFRPKPVATVEVAMPAARQADGSLILERAPDAKAVPAQQIPKGAKVERIERIVVRPMAPSTSAVATAPTSGPGQQAAALTPALPSTTTVDLTLLRMPDESQRVVASSPDGTIVGGVDIPVSAAPAEPKRTGIGGYDPIHKAYLAGYLHKLGPFQVGIVGTYSALPKFNGYLVVGMSW
jgi:hypothetical protein